MNSETRTETRRTSAGSAAAGHGIGDHGGMRHIALALLLLLTAACGPDPITRESSRAELCAATCRCETDDRRADCEAACVSPDGEWPVWPAGCVLEIANCVQEAETCEPYYVTGPSRIPHGTQAECWEKCEAGE